MSRQQRRAAEREAAKPHREVTVSAANARALQQAADPMVRVENKRFRDTFGIPTGWRYDPEMTCYERGPVRVIASFVCPADMHLMRSTPESDAAADEVFSQLREKRGDEPAPERTDPRNAFTTPYVHVSVSCRTGLTEKIMREVFDLFVYKHSGEGWYELPTIYADGRTSQSSSGVVHLHAWVPEKFWPKTN